MALWIISLALNTNEINKRIIIVAQEGPPPGDPGQQCGRSKGKSGGYRCGCGRSEDGRRQTEE